MVFWLALILTFSPGEKEQPFCVPGFADKSDNRSTDLPRSFEEAEAWNVTIEKRHELPAKKDGSKIPYSIPALSHDFRRILDCVGDPWFDPGQNASGDHFSLVIRSVDSFEIIKEISLKGSGYTVTENASMAFSPDNKKAVLGPVRWDFSDETNLLFIDLDTSKLTGIQPSKRPANDSPSARGRGPG